MTPCYFVVQNVLMNRVGWLQSHNDLVAGEAIPSNASSITVCGILKDTILSHLFKMALGKTEVQLTILFALKATYAKLSSGNRTQ